MTKVAKKQDKKEPEEAPEKESEEKRMPMVNVDGRGTTDMLLDIAETAYLEKHPDKATRFAFHSEHLKQHSKVVKHKLGGYRTVKVKELGLDEEEAEMYGGPDDNVRVGDTVLMACDKEVKRAREKKLHDKAAREANVPVEVYKADLKRRGVEPGGSIKQGTMEVGLASEDKEGGE